VDDVLDGLHRLIENNRFTTDKKMEDLKLEFKRQSDSTEAYLQERCVYGSTYFEDRKVLFEDYKIYSDDINIIPDTDRVFYNKVRNLPRVKEGQREINGKQERCFLGLKIGKIKKNRNKKQQKQQKHYISTPKVELNNPSLKELQTHASTASPAFFSHDQVKSIMENILAREGSLGLTIFFTEIITRGFPGIKLNDEEKKMLKKEVYNILSELEKEGKITLDEDSVTIISLGQEAS